jgi:hypothetical protein
MGVKSGCKPRSDVLQGELVDAIFAASFGQLIRGEGPGVYRDPAQFFQNTFPTDALRSLCQRVFGPIADPAEAGRFFRLSTGFGGGKTHALMSLFGGKEIRSLVFAAHKRWGQQWRWLGFPKPRLLYGLDRLGARPEAPVIICEGEKAADAADALLHDHVAITSPGGSKAAKMADWSALAGRKATVTIWCDADEPGQGYARDVCEMLAKLTPTPAVAIVKPPEGVSEGWDATDALAAGWTRAQAAELIGRAIPASGDGAAASHERKTQYSRMADRSTRRGRAVARSGARRLCDCGGRRPSRKPRAGLERLQGLACAACLRGDWQCPDGRGD